MAVRFTQYLRPHGQRLCVEFLSHDPELDVLAKELADAGWSFECEVLPDGSVNMDCCDEDEQLSNKLVENGPEVVDACNWLVTHAHRTWVERGRPQAVGRRAEWAKNKPIGFREGHDQAQLYSSSDDDQWH